MKTKDFGFFQQHAEKLALGLGALVLVGVAATQFLMGEPYAIELNNQAVAPNEIKDTVVTTYDRLDRELKGESPVEERVIPKYAESFQRLYKLPVATAERLSPFDIGGLAQTWINIESPEYIEKFLPGVPVATDILAKSGHGVLEDNGSESYFQVRNLIGDHEPADFPYVSVSANFPLKEWTDRLRAPGVPQEKRIDEGLWALRLVQTSVQLLREEQDPVTGKWGNRTLIDPLPGQYAVLPDDKRELPLEEAQAMEKWIVENQADFRRTAFPEIVNGPWTPPDQSNRVFTAEELERQRQLEREITRLERQIDSLTGRDRDAERRDRGRGRDRGRAAGGGDEFGGAGGYGGEDYGGGGGADRRGGGRDRGNSDRDAEREARAREQQNQRIEQTRQELITAQQELNELLGVDEEEYTPGRGGGGEFGGGYGEYGGGEFGGGEFGGGYGEYGGGGGYGGGGSRARAEDTPERVKVWAHDLTAEPGKTYRYKVVVSVLNPLYRFPRLPKAQLEENFNRASIAPKPDELDAAPWSAPLTLDPEYYFFALSGSKDQKRASFEVWTVHNGKWRSSEFTEFPGNEIGGDAEIEGLGSGGGTVPMNVRNIMLDVDSVAGSTGRPTVRVLYLDPDSGRIDFRLVSDDKNSDDRKRLENEQQRQDEQDRSRVSERF